MGEQFKAIVRMSIKGGVTAMLIWLMYKAMAADVSKDFAMGISAITGSAVSALFRDMREEHSSPSAQERE